MCEPVTLTAIIAGATTAATAAASAGATALGTVGTLGGLLGGAGAAGTAGATAASTSAITGAVVGAGGTTAATTAAGTAAGGVLGTGFTAGQVVQGGVLAAGLATGAQQAVAADEAAGEAEVLSQDKAKLAQAEANRELGEAGEVAAQERFNLAREALSQRSVAQNSGLSANSVRALSRSADFQAGLDKTTVSRNLEIKRQRAAATLRGVQLTRTAEKTTTRQRRTKLAGSLVGAGVRSVDTGLQIGASLDR